MPFPSRFHIIALDTTAAPPKARKESVQLEPSKHFPVPQDILDAEKSVPAPQVIPSVNPYIPVPREVPPGKVETETEATCKPPWAIIKRGAKSPKQPKSAAVAPVISPEKEDIPVPPGNDTAEESVPKPTAVPAVNEGTEPSARLPWSIRKRTAKQPKQSQSVTVPPEVEIAKDSAAEPREVPSGKESIPEPQGVPPTKEATETPVQLSWFRYRRPAKPPKEPKPVAGHSESKSAKESVPVIRDIPLESERVRNISPERASLSLPKRDPDFRDQTDRRPSVPEAAKESVPVARAISPAWDSLSLPKGVWLTDETDTPAQVHWFRFKRTAKPPKEPKSGTDHSPETEPSKESVPVYQEVPTVKEETGTDTEKDPDTYRTWTGTENRDHSPGHRRKRAAKLAAPAVMIGWMIVHPFMPI